MLIMFRMLKFVSPLGMTQVWPKRCCCLVKNELKWAGPFGIAALLCGTVFIDRLNREKALDTMKKTAGTILSRNVSFVKTAGFTVLELVVESGFESSWYLFKSKILWLTRK